jgi:hypothetical protein
VVRLGASVTQNQVPAIPTLRALLRLRLAPIHTALRLHVLRVLLEVHVGRVDENGSVGVSATPLPSVLLESGRANDGIAAAADDAAAGLLAAQDGLQNGRKLMLGLSFTLDVGVVNLVNSVKSVRSCRFERGQAGVG